MLVGVVGRGNSNGLTRGLCATDGTVHDVVVGTVHGTSCRDVVFFYCIARSVIIDHGDDAGCFVCHSLAALLFSSNLHRIVTLVDASADFNRNFTSNTGIQHNGALAVLGSADRLIESGILRAVHGGNDCGGCFGLGLCPHYIIEYSIVRGRTLGRDGRLRRYLAGDFCYNRFFVITVFALADCNTAHTGTSHNEQRHGRLITKPCPKIGNRIIVSLCADGNGLAGKLGTTAGAVYDIVVRSCVLAISGD